jgi:polar amino acid transport system substrate-binding protein
VKTLVLSSKRLLLCLILSGFSSFLLATTESEPTVLIPSQSVPSQSVPIQPAMKALATPVTVVTEYLPPFQQKNDDGSLGGYSTEVVRALYALMGEKLEIQVLPWARAYSTALRGKNVLIYSMSYSKERAKLFHWVGILEYEQGYIWGLKSRFPRPPKSLDAMRSYSVSVTHGSLPDAYLSRKGFSNVHHVVNAEQNIGMLFRRRVDLIVGTELPLRAFVKKQSLDFKKVTKLFKAKGLNTNLQLAFSKDTDPAILARFQQSFKQLQQSKEFKAIRQKWGLVD